MDYCRALTFEQEPDYSRCIRFWDSCMTRHEYDTRVYDYTWKQNRLSKDKEMLKSAMMNVIKKKPKKEANQDAAKDGAAAK